MVPIFLADLLLLVIKLLPVWRNW